MAVHPGVWKTAAGRWATRPSVGGRRHYGEFATRAEAERWRAALVARRRDARAGLTTPEPAPTLGRLLDRHETELAALGRAAKTIAQAEQLGALWRRALGDGHLTPLSREDVVRFVAWMRVHSRTTGRYLAAALGLIRTAHRRAGLPVPWTPTVRAPRRGRRILTAEQRNRFLAALPARSVERTVAAVVYLALARESEALRLCVEDLALEASSLRLRAAKGTSPGPVEVLASPALVAALEAYAAPDDGPLFRLRGRPLGELSLRRRLESASARAKIDPPVRSLGWLRNQAATDLGEIGVPDRVIRLLLRHAGESVTDRYNRARRIEEQRAALARLTWPEPLAVFGRETRRSPQIPSSSGDGSGSPGTT